MDETPHPDSETRFDESALLEHYDLLEEAGVLDRLRELRSDVRFQREIIEEALQIFRKRTVEDLIDHVIARILDRFVPTYLVFIVRPQPYSADLDIIVYKNMTRVEYDLRIHSLEPFSDFFARYPQPVSYSLLEHEVGESGALDPFSPIGPEIVAPVIGPGGLMGLIIFGGKLVDEDYTNREIAYINRLMQFGAAALQNIIHYQSASRDSKTRLFNHSYFMNRLEEEMRRYHRYGHPFTVLLCDLDHFKDINDTYGHPAGDYVLFEFARTLEEQTRSVDVVARYGGEEFIILLLETAQTGGFRIGERIRKAIEGRAFAYEGRKIAVTCSIGGCHISVMPSQNGADVVSSADQSLYWAKQHGRNRTAMYGAGLYFKSAYYYADRPEDGASRQRRSTDGHTV